MIENIDREMDRSMSGFGDLGLDLVDAAVDGMLVLLKIRFNKLVEDNGGTEGTWVEEVHVEGELDQVVEGEEGEQVADKAIGDGEQAEHDPVGEPLLIVLITSRFERFETHVRRIYESNKVADQGGTNVQET